MVYTIDEIRERVTPVALRYGLQAVYLFGSYARGEATELSDIDLLVDTSGTCLTGLVALGGLYCDLEGALEKSIDLVTLSSLEQRSHMPSEDVFKAEVQREKVRLYAVA